MLKIFERNDIRSHFKALGEAKVASIIIDVPLRILIVVKKMVKNPVGRPVKKICTFFYEEVTLEMNERYTIAEYNCQI